MIVYVIWYQVKWNDFKTVLQWQNSWSGVQISIKSWNSIWDSIPVIQTENTWSIYTTWTAIATTWDTASGDIIAPVIMKANTGITLLSGTSIYYWSIAIIQQLGIKYQYALVDWSWTRYIYLGTPSYDFASIARALQGNLYTLATEQDILQNKLFGNKVVFMNLPEYKDKQVLMLLYLNDGIRLVQMEYSLYHKSKTYLKSLFID